MLKPKMKVNKEHNLVQSLDRKCVRHSTVYAWPLKNT
jgi:hypothetical protein